MAKLGDGWTIHSVTSFTSLWYIWLLQSKKMQLYNRQRRLSYDNIILGTAIHYRHKSTVVNSTLLIQIDDSKYSDPIALPHKCLAQRACFKATCSRECCHF